jgi:hypothetical protein
VIYGRVLKYKYDFITNLFDLYAYLVAIYKIRHQIDLLLKQLKQNFLMKNFQGNNEKCHKNPNLLHTDSQHAHNRITKTKEKSGIFNLVSFL